MRPTSSFQLYSTPLSLLLDRLSPFGYLESVPGPRKNSKNLILVLYLLLGVSCLVWLAAHAFYFSPQGAGGDNFAMEDFARREEALQAPQEDPAADRPSDSGPAPPGRETAGQGRPQAEKPAAAQPPAPGGSPPPRGGTWQPAAKGRIAIILDDAGYQNALLKTFVGFGGRLTVAVLPGLPGSAEAARIIRAAGKETMLHLPMQPRRGEDPGPQAILSSMDDQTILRLTKKHIDSLPGLKGVNNHMGSLATEDPRVMGLVLGVLKERGLFFIDSRTTTDSAGPRIASRLGLPFRERSVFLDNEQDALAIQGYFETGKQIAAKQGWAVMIGHVWCAELAGLLPLLYEKALAEGYEFLFASELLAGPGP
ncbi:MAG: divergent polysaccharide deacetylase family protein [Spirochaetia bacterium]|jgi:polysaccharide deacetylase 2 family uncharacterized protein YibQ|nr:divergent polysaccharide deacetylase family protein [Spirochaetia bacterium]